MSSVTVIIVNWNGGTLLEQCLINLKRQSLVPAKILVVDNGSSDNSIDIAEMTLGVTIKLLGNNFGFAAANNRALEECETEYVALLNPDAFPEKDWLMHMITAARTQSDVVAFGSRQLDQSNPQILDGLGDSYHLSGAVWRECHGTQQQQNDLVPKEIFSPCAAAALYRRDALEEIGGFDEDFFCYLEDVDLGFRLRLAGHKIMYLPDAVVHHVGSALTGGQHGDFSVYHGHRNLVWTFIKNMPGLLFWFLLPFHLILNLVTIVWFIKLGKGKVILRSKWDAIKGIPRMWVKRKQIQRNRKATISDIWRVLDKSLVRNRRN